MMLETNKNYFADNRDVLKTIPDKSINLFLEDMPYNTTGCDWEYEVDLKEYWELRLPKLADNGVFVLTGSQPFTSILITSNIKLFKYEWIWEKNRGSNFTLTKYAPMKEHESVLVFCKTSPKYFPIMQERKGGGLDRTKYKYNPSNTGKSDFIGNLIKTHANHNGNNELRYPSSIQKFNCEVGIHPTQKPIELFSYFINTYTNENDIVFDGYSGSGTTAISCLRTNRQYIICENKKEYFDLQTKRIQEEIDKTSLFNSLGGRQDRLSA